MLSYNVVHRFPRGDISKPTPSKGSTFDQPTLDPTSPRKTKFSSFNKKQPSTKKISLSFPLIKQFQHHLTCSCCNTVFNCGTLHLKLASKLPKPPRCNASRALCALHLLRCLHRWVGHPTAAKTRFAPNEDLMDSSTLKILSHRIP